MICDKCVIWQDGLCLLPDFNSWHFRANGGLSRSIYAIHLSCISGTVHHDTPPIKGSIMSTVRPTDLPSEVALLTRNDVVKEDFHETVTIRPHHFVDCPCKFGMDSSKRTLRKPTKSMERFMKDHPNGEALWTSQVDDLAIGGLSPHKGVASISRVVLVSKR